MLAARAEKSAKSAAFKVGAVVEALPIAFGADFAAKAPAEALYRGRIVELEEDGELEDARIWRVKYDDDGSVYATSEAHLSLVAGGAAKLPPRTSRPRARSSRGATLATTDD